MLAAVTYMGFGIPYIYMGQEIGLTNTDFENIDELKDPVSHFVYDLMCSYGMPKSLAFRFIRYGARDHARVPMPWDGSEGGWSGKMPWQSRYTERGKINVRKDLASEKSVYRFYRKLLEIKKTNETAIFGNVEEYDHDSRKIIAFSREYEGNRLFVVGNFSKHPAEYRLPGWTKYAETLLDNYGEFSAESGTVTLRPYEAAVLEVRR